MTREETIRDYVAYLREDLAQHAAGEDYAAPIEVSEMDALIRLSTATGEGAEEAYLAAEWITAAEWAESEAEEEATW